MDEIRIGEQVGHLVSRRVQAVITLGYVKKERAEVERNTDWLDRAAYQSRMRLLGRLADWYNTEIEQIDMMLRRSKSNYLPLSPRS